MSATSGHEIGRGNGRIAWPLLGLFFELVLRAGLAGWSCPRSDRRPQASERRHLASEPRRVMLFNEPW